MCYNENMKYQKNESEKGKISPVFSARLNRLGPDQKVGAILLLLVHGVKGNKGYRRTPSDIRQASINATRKSAAKALHDIDAILERFGGKRLAENPDALGSIHVETTPAGIRALAASDRIKAILEDQAISLAH